jgi:hypothetical protein
MNSAWPGNENIISAAQLKSDKVDGPLMLMVVD